MTDAELLAIVESEERNALGYGDGDLNSQREKALKYYNAELYGNEQEGRSQVVTTEVQDAVEWMLPSLLKIFTASDKAVEFEPERPDDEMAAKQATDAVNYVFYRQNNGFLALHTFFKDALLTKTGYIKVFYEKAERKRKESYRGLTEQQLTLLTMRPGVEMIAGSSYPDPSFPGQQAPMQEGVAPQAPPNLYDVQLEITEPYGVTRVIPLPPEEVLVSKDLNEVDPRNAPFIAHRCEKTISELRAMGYEVDDIPSDDDSASETPEAIARDEFDEATTFADKVDKSMRKVWVTEAYIRVDYDDDGEAELRKVVKAAHKILENEEADVIPIAAITPTIMTHRHFGKSVADRVMDLQLIKSTITRQVLDNVYLTNSPRKIVLSNATNGAPLANFDDLLSVRVGGVVREYAPNAVRSEETPFMGQYGIQMLEYLDTVKDSRIGYTGQFSGTDPNALNKTARGAILQQNNSMQQIEMIARVFAETGVKRIFQLILHCLVKYGTGRPLTIRLRDQWVEFDPSTWNDQMDMVVNVGLGTGDKDQQLVHLQSISMAQLEAIKAGGMGLLVTPKNVYNTQAKIVENAGFKNVEDFWTDPGDKMPEPQPDPNEKKAQMDMQAKQQDMALRAREADQEFAHKQRMAELDFVVEQQKMGLEREKMAMGLAHEQQRAQFGLQTEQQRAEFDMQHKARDADFSMEIKAREEEARQVPKLEQVTNQLMEALGQLAQAQQQMMDGLQQVAKIAGAKRKAKIIRDPSGRAIGAESELIQ